MVLVYDLLDPGFSSNDVGTPRKKALDIRHGENNTVEVPGLLSESVNTVSDVLKALDRGNSNRAKASTNLNEHSSRSHMVLRVDVTSGVGEAKNKGSLYLVDLAGEYFSSLRRLPQDRKNNIFPTMVWQAANVFAKAKWKERLLRRLSTLIRVCLHWAM